jgi:hypothetical protein
VARNEGEKKCVHGFGGGNLNGRRTLGRTGSRWEDKIKTCLKGVG